MNVIICCSAPPTIIYLYISILCTDRNVQLIIVSMFMVFGFLRDIFSFIDARASEWKIRFNLCRMPERRIWKKWPSIHHVQIALFHFFIVCLSRSSAFDSKLKSVSVHLHLSRLTDVYFIQYLKRHWKESIFVRSQHSHSRWPRDNKHNLIKMKQRILWIYISLLITCWWPNDIDNDQTKQHHDTECVPQI